MTDGSGHQLDTGFGVGWSNNLNEGRHLGKTFGKFMRNKFFQPDSKRNLIISGFTIVYFSSLNFDYIFLFSFLDIANTVSKKVKFSIKTRKINKKFSEYQNALFY